MSLDGTIAVITGGSGIVGSGIVHQFLAQGAHVIAPVRSDDAKSRLLEDTKSISNRDELLTALVVGDYATEDGATTVADSIAKLAQNVDHIVSCYGGSFKMGTASLLTPEDIHQAMNRAIPHLLLAKALFPLLKKSDSSAFTFITGMLGERCSMPNCAALTIANAAIYGMIRALEAEHADDPQRINELRIAALIRRDSQPGHPFVTSSHAYSANLIGDVAVEVAVGQQRREIIRVLADDLAAKEKAM